jgi:hypothetical protein
LGQNQGHRALVAGGCFQRRRDPDATTTRLAQGAANEQEMIMRRILLCLCFLSGLATTASADIVPMPPAACPLGSNPRTCHGGAYCEVRNCQTDTDCTAGAGTCQEMRACFHMLDCLGRVIMLDAARPLYNSMKSACPASGVCADTNQECQTQKVCVVGSGTSTVTSPLTSTTTSIATRSNTATGTRSATQTVTSIATSPTNTSTGVRTDPVTSVTSASRTQNVTATQTEARTINATGLSTGAGSGTGTGQTTAPTSNTGSGTRTASAVETTTTRTSTGTSITATNDTTSQQTGQTTSAAPSTGTAQDAGTARAKLGDSGCSCRMGDWADAKAIGPWLLAGMFGAVVALLRRRRTRK